MIVECQSCSTIFPVDPNKVPEGGIHARCSVCSEVFFVTVPESEREAVEPTPVEVPPVEAAPVVEAEPEIAEAEAPEVVEAEIPEAEAEIDPAPPEPEAVVETPEPEIETTPSPPVEEQPAGFHEPTFGAMEDVGTAEAAPAAPLFGKRDPMEKAQRLARVLVSDIILYNPDRHHSATESGRVKEEFEEEIQKSWNEYVEQVGEDVANTTTYFNDALNEILAKGEKIF